MKIFEAVIFTDGDVIRITTTDDQRFYLTKEKKLYDMHTINVMAKEIEKSLASKVLKLAKTSNYTGKELVEKWL